MLNLQPRHRGAAVLSLTLLTLTGLCTAQTPNATPVAAAGAGAGLTNGALVASGGISGATAPVPQLKGFNFTLNSTSQHSSVTGWSSMLTPDLSFRFDKHFSLDVNVPYYLDIQNFVQTTVKKVTTYPLEQSGNLIGDTGISGHFNIGAGDFGYGLNASGSFPTGDSKFGLTANAATYNVTNHLEYSLGRFNPDIEAGEGNSSSLVNHGVKKSYTAVGPIANFQAGGSIDLPFKSSLDLEAYEALPLGNQDVYGTVTKTNKKGKTVAKQTLEGTGVRRVGRSSVPAPGVGRDVSAQPDSGHRYRRHLADLGSAHAQEEGRTLETVQPG